MVKEHVVGKREREGQDYTNLSIKKQQRITLSKEKEVRSDSVAKCRTFESYPLTLLFQDTSYIFSERMCQCHTSHTCHPGRIAVIVSPSQ